MAIEVNDAQVWSVIGVLAATLVSMVVGMFALFTRTMKAQFGRVDAQFGRVDAQFEALRAELTGFRGEVQAQFRAVDAQFKAVDARFEATNQRIDDIDRDIQVVFTRVFRTGGEQV